jgi:hypothetical protein
VRVAFGPCLLEASMPVLSSFVVYLVLTLVVSVAAVAPTRAGERRVRPLDPSAAGALERGQHHSGRFRELVRELNASDVIVHVVTSPGLAPGVAGTTRFVAHLGGARYLRVDLASTLSPNLQVVILAHELQHACEVARSAASSSSDVRTLYEGIGRALSGQPTLFETAEAVRTGLEVSHELRTGRGRVRAVEE